MSRNVRFACAALCALLSVPAEAQFNPLTIVSKAVTTSMDVRTKAEVSADTEIAAGASKRLLDDKNSEWSGVTVMVFAQHVVLAVAIAAGGTHSVALQSDGRLLAWGNNSQGQTTVPQSLNNVIQISAGDSHTAALSSSGEVTVFGGGLYFPTVYSNITSIASGGYFVAGLRSDGVVVGSPGAGVESNVVAIAAGGNVRFSLNTDGTVTGWGSVDGKRLVIPDDVTNVTCISQLGQTVAWHFSPMAETRRGEETTTDKSRCRPLPTLLQSARALHTIAQCEGQSQAFFFFYLFFYRFFT